MKILAIPFAFLFMSCFAEFLYGEIPDLEAGVYIQDGTSPLEVGGYSSPTVADWNNDGRKDILAGNITGNVWLYLNHGTDLNPVFNGGVRIESNGVPIVTSTS